MDRGERGRSLAFMDSGGGGEAGGEEEEVQMLFFKQISISFMHTKQISSKDQKKKDPHIRLLPLFHVQSVHQIEHQRTR